MTAKLKPKFFWICVFTLILIHPLFGQIQTSRHTIDSAFDGGFWVYVTDFDQDGDPDIVAAALRSSLKWYENDGNGNFTIKNISNSFSNAWSVHANDIDGDGDLDVVACSEDPGEIAWFKRAGSENFSKNTVDINILNPHSVYSADLDNDGDVDLMAAVWKSDQVIWYENDGQENFSKHILDNNFSSAHSIHAADLDKDGDIDIMASGGSKTSWWRNNGNGGFSRNEFASFGAFCVYAHDVDGDGRLDVLRNQRNNGDIDWIENKGGTNFLEHSVQDAVGESWSIVAGDLDLDGDEDIVAAAFVPNKVLYWLNNGSEGFTQFVLDNNVVRPRGVSVADFDRDGDKDIVAVTRNDYLLWYEVTGSPNPPATLTVTAPNGGETFQAGSEATLQWTSTGVINSVDLEYSIDGGNSWVTIAAAVTNNGSASWTVPDVESSQAFIRILDSSSPSTSDTSDGPFTIIVKRSLTLTSPNGGEIWNAGTTRTVTWNSSGSINTVNLALSVDSGVTWASIASNVLNTGSFVWVVPDSSTTTAKVSVSDASDAALADTSDAVFSIVKPVLTVTSPNGGEVWAGGSEHTLTWTSAGEINFVKLEYSTDGGASWLPIIASVNNSGSFSWTVPDVVTQSALVRISDAATGDPVDVSDSSFAIIQSTLTLLSPNGGESWMGKSGQLITWSGTGEVNSVKLEYSTDSGVSWVTIISATENNGSFSWTVPDVTTDNALVRISDTVDGNPFDLSDNRFQIVGSSLNLTSPNGGEVWYSGTSQTLSWTSTGMINSVNLEYSLNDGSDWMMIAANVPNTGNYLWNIPAVETDSALVRISDATDGTPKDVSDSLFTILTAGLTVVSPNGGETLFGGKTHTITWTSTGPIGSVSLEYSLDSGNAWEIILSAAANNGSHEWLVPDIQSTGVLIKITDLTNNLQDTSDTVFSIVQSGLTLIAPNGGENFLAENDAAIVWNTAGQIDSVMLEYSLDGGVQWMTLTRAANGGSLNWTVPNVRTNLGLIRVSDAFDGAPADVSDATFSIIASSLTVTAPNGGESWTVGSERTITWHSTGVIDSVALDFSIDAGKSWLSIINETPNDGSYVWLIPEFQSDSVFVRVSDAKDSTPFDISDESFSIAVIATGIPERTSDDSKPDKFQLFQNYPNPFNLQTRIDFSVPRQARASLSIFNVKGELVRHLFVGELLPGVYSSLWDGRDQQGRVVTSGLYIYKIRIGEWQASKKLMLVK
ncbi:MAG: FG-GAP-like repeat-containing protein [bacterium]